MGQFVSFPLPPRTDCSAVHRLLPAIYSQSRRNELLGELRTDCNNALLEGGDDFEAKFRSLFAYFEEARQAHETRQMKDVTTNANEANRSKNVEAELKVLKRQLTTLGDLFDQFLDTSLATRERTRRMEDEWARRFERLESENTLLKAHLEEAVVRFATHKNDANFGGNEQQSNGVSQTVAALNLENLSVADDHGAPPQENEQRQEQNGGVDGELTQFFAGLPPVDESGQLVLNKFKYSCEFAQLLYTGGRRVDSVFCNIFSEYPVTFFEELVEYALTTHRTAAMIRRICIWLAADEPWPDMATLFPSATLRNISDDRALYEFHNIGQSCGQQQRKQAEFVLRIRAPSKAKLFRTMSNFSLNRK